MADFTSSFWGWFIGISTILSIIAMFVLLFKCSSKKTGTENDKVETMGHVWDEDLEELNNPLPSWWLYLFVVTLIWGAVYLVMYPGLGFYAGFLNWTQKGQLEQEMQIANATYGPLYEKYKNTELSELAKNEAALKIGERLYASYCTTCHGSDARGARGYPNLRDDDWLYGGEPEQIKTTIMQGRQGAMPAWEEILDKGEIFNVTAYIEELAGRQVDSVHAGNGKEIYKKNCAVCHGADAKGNIMFGAPNLTNDIWLYGGSQKKIAESIIKGRNGVMPPNKEFLGEAKIHILAAYIYSLTE